MRILLCVILLLSSGVVMAALPEQGLLLDLDASKGLKLDEGNRVTVWENQAPGKEARRFAHRDEGRKVAGEGRPTLRKNVATLNGAAALVFRQQELVCDEEDTFDGLIKGKGHTWIGIIAVHEQRVGLKGVNSFFGNLRNGGYYEGIWGCVDDDNHLWWGARNGRSFGRFDSNNPKLDGPKLSKRSFHLVAGRMAAGKENAKLELFINGTKAVAEADFPVNTEANPSRMTIGQERDAIEHPGHESFDGEIARLLIWERPLTDAELKQTVNELMIRYGLESTL